MIGANRGRRKKSRRHGGGPVLMYRLGVSLSSSSPQSALAQQMPEVLEYRDAQEVDLGLLWELLVFTLLLNAWV